MKSVQIVIDTRNFISALLAKIRTVNYLQERAKRASREKFEKAMSKVPDVEPEKYDRL